MHYITLGCLQITLSFPHIIRNMVTVNTQSQIILGNPEVRQNDVLILIVQRRKKQSTNAVISVVDEIRSSPP